MSKVLVPGVGSFNAVGETAPSTSRRVRKLIVTASLGTASVATSLAHAAVLTVYGGPTYDSTTGIGFISQGVTGVNNAGTVTMEANKYSGTNNLGRRALRFDTLGSTELGNLGLSSTGSTSVGTGRINSSGLAAGSARKYTNDTSATLLGSRPVRFDPSATAAIELGTLGVDSSGKTDGGSGGVNSAGTLVGTTTKYISGVSRGTRAVRWDPLSATAVELDSLGTSAGTTTSGAYNINDVGTIVGYANKYDGNGTNLGVRPVRWAASGTAATELGTLGTDSHGSTFAEVSRIIHLDSQPDGLINTSTASTWVRDPCDGGHRAPRRSSSVCWAWLQPAATVSSAD